MAVSRLPDFSNIKVLFLILKRTVSGVYHGDLLHAGLGDLNVGVLDVLGVHGLDELAGGIEHERDLLDGN